MREDISSTNKYIVLVCIIEHLHIHTHSIRTRTVYSSVVCVKFVFAVNINNSITFSVKLVVTAVIRLQLTFIDCVFSPQITCKANYQNDLKFYFYSFVSNKTLFLKDI